jgi:hypothetical protein
VITESTVNRLASLQLNTIDGNPTSRTATISVSGPTTGGACERALLNWGDGTPSQSISGAFPLKSQHTYQDGVGGTWNIDVKAAQGVKCEGEVSAKFITYPKIAKLNGMDLNPNQGKVKPGDFVKFLLKGSGLCLDLRVDQGDNTVVSMGQVAFNSANGFTVPTLPLKYAKTGDYVVTVKDWGSSACGSASAPIKVETALEGIQLPPGPLHMTAVPGASVPTAAPVAGNPPATPSPAPVVSAPCRAPSKPGVNPGKCGPQ